MQYTLKANFRVPYFSTVVPIDVVLDEVSKRQVVNYYNGMDGNLYRFDTGKVRYSHRKNEGVFFHAH